jgi:mono/diheme cytochrome c family protein
MIINHMRALVVAAFLCTVAVSAQQPTAPTYTADQAQRGEHVVSGHCVECHGDLLQGTEGPALKGAPFMKWLTGRSIGAAFTKIQETMPLDAEDTVTDDEKLDALAYLLQVNGVPEGESELPADVEALNNMRVPPRAGVALQSGAAVEATGCLQKGAGNEWLLTGSAGAVAPTVPGAPAGAPATPTPAGAPRTLRLLNVFPAPTAHVSHTVKVAGLLVLDAEGQAINATSLTMVSDSCAK